MVKLVAVASAFFRIAESNAGSAGIKVIPHTTVGLPSSVGFCAGGARGIGMRNTYGRTGGVGLGWKPNVGIKALFCCANAGAVGAAIDTTIAHRAKNLARIKPS